MAVSVPPCIALTMGDPTGVGPELALKAWRARKDHQIPPFVYIGDGDHLRTLSDQLGLDVRIALVDDVSAAADLFSESLPVLGCELRRPAECGAPHTDHVETIIAALDTAIALASGEDVCAVVTNPIHKRTMWAGGFDYPGHTEYLAAKTKSEDAPNKTAMMLVVPGLRVVPVTIHIPLKDVSSSLTTEAIVRAGELTHRALSHDFAIPSPAIAVAGLNPHGGEDGTLGREERETIEPAIAFLRESHIDAQGPFAADSLFAKQSRSRFDAILAMYHDQALIPLKTVDFDRGVNFTLGLPIVRTSPDHGTAHDIAGKGIARPDSLIMALNLARDVSANRASA